MTANRPKPATDPKVDQALIDRLRALLDVRETRYVVLVTDERQQRVFDAREVSLAEMVAILDAYGEPTAAGKLHISMHVSSEKTGRGALVFRRTGKRLRPFASSG